jgi:hypothetical protein
LVVGIIYSASWTDLKNIVQWLRGRDESQWAEQAKVLSDTIVIFEELSDPIAGTDGSPEATGIAIAMPCLQGMLTAMQGRRRQDALDFGSEALKLLPYG